MNPFWLLQYVSRGSKPPTRSGIPHFCLFHWSPIPPLEPAGPCRAGLGHFDGTLPAVLIAPGIWLLMVGCWGNSGGKRDWNANTSSNVHEFTYNVGHFLGGNYQTSQMSQNHLLFLLGEMKRDAIGMVILTRIFLLDDVLFYNGCRHSFMLGVNLTPSRR